MLVIRGEQRAEHVEEAKEKKYIRSERSFGRVVRRVTLPKNINKDKITASYVNGILHVRQHT